MIEKIKALLKNPKIQEMISYVFFGALTTLVNWCVYVFLTYALGMQQHLRGSAMYILIGNAATLCAWVLSVLFAFFTNKRYVFHSSASRQSGAWKEFLLFISARIMSYLIFDMLLYTALLYVMNDKMDKLLMNVLVILFNYAASKWVIFRKQDKK
ncbi:MAG: GtrA family protein [Clostridia bacterium]|nr:GtrA family protein [Clostridia bacterium]